MAKLDFLPSQFQVVLKPIEWLKPSPTNPRKWTQIDVEQFAAAVRRYKFRVPILCDPQGNVVDGHFRLAVAEHLKMAKVPCIPSDDWTPEAVREFRISVNRMGELAGWDETRLLEDLEQLKTEGAPLGDDGPIGFGLEAIDHDIEPIAWDFSLVEDVHVLTIRSPLPLAAEVKKRLKDLQGVSITEDNLELP
jgi:hypothetical protein